MTTSNSNTQNDIQKPKESGERSEGAKLKIKRSDKKKVLRSRWKRKILKHKWVIRGFFILTTLLFLGTAFYLVFNSLSDTKLSYYYGLGKNFLIASEGKADSLSGRINILILGKGGEGHDAPDLTDTIILASIDHTDNKITMISIPRDIWVPSIRAKINSAYYWGNRKEPPTDEDLGGGLVLAKSTTEEVLGQPVHYAAVFDFEAFKQIINTLGGVELDVENSFTDERFPIPGKEDDDCGGDDPEYECRYETIRFEEGIQSMDGERALKFVRSRNAEGDEGTDIARAKRQEKVIEALKEKIFSSAVFSSPQTLFKLKDIVVENTITDLTPEEAAVLARWVFDARKDLKTNVIPESLLENPPISPKYDNLYVFIPSADDPETPQNEWGEVHEWVEDVLE